LARITKFGIEYHLGTFDTVKEASFVYQEKVRELFGEFSPF
jgi:hypothetical protein